MSLTPSPRHAGFSRTTLILVYFGLVCAVWRGIWLPFSQSSYTDGLLQVDMFQFGVGYWPPLYAVLTRLFAWIPGLGLEGAGRLVSFLCGVLMVFPLGVLTARLLGWRAARWALAVWIVSPIATRWSLQVMTDMPMLLFWTSALLALVLAAEKYRPELFPSGDIPSAPDPRAGAGLLALASICAVFATLTRFQGILLLPLILVASLRLPTAGSDSGRRWWALLPWLAFPAWLLRGGLAPVMNHFQQIGERAQSAGALQTFLNIYWFQFEDFILYSPYFISWGLFGFFLYGLFRTNWSTPRLRWLGFGALYLTLAILALQSIFSSFQSRYLLPLGPFVCIFAGHGFATWERHCAERSRHFWFLAAPSLVLALVVSGLVAAFQGSPFLDIKQAGQKIAAEIKPAPEQAIYSNEVYNAKIGAAKLAFWTGHHVIQPLPLTQTRGGELMLMVDQMQPKTGDLIVISSAYGGAENYGRLIETVRSYLDVEELGRFNHSLIPIDPDIMQDPGTHQNPLALSYRYRPQRFQTILLRVASRPAVLDTTPPVLPSESDATRKAIQDLQDFSSTLSPPSAPEARFEPQATPEPSP